MIRIGIVGFPYSGKTTLLEVLALSSGISHHESVLQVKVPDSRLDKLEKIYEPKKVTPAVIEFEEIGRVDPSDERSNRSVFTKVQEVDVVLVVLKAFKSSLVPEVPGYESPDSQMDYIEDYFLERDKEVLRGRIDRLESAKRKLTNVEEIELNVIKEALKDLEEEGKIDEINGEKLKILSSFSLTVMKPKFFLANVGEDTGFERADLSMNLKLVKDLLELDEGERKMFMEEYGIDDLGLEDLIKSLLEKAKYGFFYTVAHGELRAWEMKLGSTAIEIAGKIHTDMARGFIRAEIFNFDDLEREGSERAVKEKGLMKVVGKDHVIQDGDIVYIRFNV